MTPKLFEVRDAGTFLVALAVKLDPSNESDRYLLGRSGFGTTPEKQSEYIQVAVINGGSGHCDCDPYNWPGRYIGTMGPAHAFIIEHFDILESGDVIDSEFLRGETAKQKQSERVEAIA